MARNTTSNYFNHVGFRKMFGGLYGQCANLSHAVVRFGDRADPVNGGALAWIVVGAYIVLIAVISSSDAFPPFRWMADSFIKVNAIVRGLIGG